MTYYRLVEKICPFEKVINKWDYYEETLAHLGFNAFYPHNSGN